MFITLITQLKNSCFLRVAETCRCITCIWTWWQIHSSFFHDLFLCHIFFVLQVLWPGALQTTAYAISHYLWMRRSLVKALQWNGLTTVTSHKLRRRIVGAVSLFTVAIQYVLLVDIKLLCSRHHLRECRVRLHRLITRQPHARKRLLLACHLHTNLQNGSDGLGTHDYLLLLCLPQNLLCLKVFHELSLGILLVELRHHLRLVGWEGLTVHRLHLHILNNGRLIHTLFRRGRLRHVGVRAVELVLLLEDHGLLWD